MSNGPSSSDSHAPSRAGDQMHRVTWEIDLPAASHEEAAREARHIQRDPDSIALVFHVRRLNEATATVVDLAALPGQTEEEHPTRRAAGLHHSRVWAAERLLHAALVDLDRAHLLHRQARGEADPEEGVIIADAIDRVSHTMRDLGGTPDGDDGEGPFALTCSNCALAPHAGSAGALEVGRIWRGRLVGDDERTLFEVHAITRGVAHAALEQAMPQFFTDYDPATSNMGDYLGRQHAHRARTYDLEPVVLLGSPAPLPGRPRAPPSSPHEPPHEPADDAGADATTTQEDQQ